MFFYTNHPKTSGINAVKTEVIYTVAIPTAEQIINWLEEQYHLSFDIYQSLLSWSCSIKHKDEECIFLDYLNSRKEATLAAIDAALEYLSNK